MYYLYMTSNSNIANDEASYFNLEVMSYLYKTKNNNKADHDTSFTADICLSRGCVLHVSDK